MTDWNEGKSQKLKEAVSSLKLVEILMSKLPKCSGQTIEERAVTGSEQQGFLNCINELKKLCEPPKKTVEKQESI